jgi:hypothetical protein
MCFSKHTDTMWNLRHWFEFIKMTSKLITTIVWHMPRLSVGFWVKDIPQSYVSFLNHPQHTSFLWLFSFKICFLMNACCLQSELNNNVFKRAFKSKLPLIMLFLNESTQSAVETVKTYIPIAKDFKGKAIFVWAGYLSLLSSSLLYLIEFNTFFRYIISIFFINIHFEGLLFWVWPSVGEPQDASFQLPFFCPLNQYITHLLIFFEMHTKMNVHFICTTFLNFFLFRLVEWKQLHLMKKRHSLLNLFVNSQKSVSQALSKYFQCFSLCSCFF